MSLMQALTTVLVADTINLATPSNGHVYVYMCMYIYTNSYILRSKYYSNRGQDERDIRVHVYTYTYMYMYM